MLLAAATLGWLIVDARPALAFYLGQLLSRLLFSLYLFELFPGLRYTGRWGFYLVQLARSS